MGAIKLIWMRRMQENCQYGQFECLVFQRFREYNLNLKPRKCNLLQSEVSFLRVSTEGFMVDPNNIKALEDWAVPRDHNQLMSFLGFANYQRDHIKRFAGRSAIFYDLASKQKSLAGLKIIKLPLMILSKCYYSMSVISIS